MDRHELLTRYELTADEQSFVEARQLYEDALAHSPTADVLYEYGYLFECHGRNEIRNAAAQYQRAIDLRPDVEIPRHKLIWARAMLLDDTTAAVSEYRQRTAAAPDDVREYRLLVSAALAAHQYVTAAEAIAAGLALAPDDARLIEQRGKLESETGDATAALTDWRRALALDPENAGPLYMSAFLLEHEGHIDQAIATWRELLDWLQQRNFVDEMTWPREELARLEAIQAR